MTHLGVDGVGKVDWCGARGKPDHFALRGEDVDFLGPDLISEGVEEFGGVFGVLLPVREMGQPRHFRRLAQRGLFSLASASIPLIF